MTDQANQAATIQVGRVGGPEVLETVSAPVSLPGPGQAQVRVAFAGVNFIDIYHRTGVYPRDLPFVPGSEGSGVVTAIGSGVTEVAVGDRVAWESLPGSYASVVTGPADRLIPVPNHVDDRTAAALPLQGLTAEYLTSASYPVQAGNTVLVHAGAGGVGNLVIQLARLAGATVLATASTAKKADLCRQAGAAAVFDYDTFAEGTQEFTGGRGVAAVYDGVGLSTFDRSLSALARRGTLVLFGGASGQVPPFDLQRLAGGGSLSITRPTLRDFVVDRAELLARAGRLFDLLADGSLTFRIGSVLPLAQAAEAQQALAGRATTGKVLLKIDLTTYHDG